MLEELEAQRIPIDCIAGTSMGAIIGGLYASGMPVEEMRATLESLDWAYIMSDETPRRELFFRRKADDQRYLLEVGVGRQGVKIAPGLAAGQKFGNLMEFLTLRASGAADFDQLPIPFRAVATDLESGRPYVIGSGHLPQAMRASMAVPGAFTPVTIDGRTLVDGGVVNNLPVDVAEAMGADIVIAVDVGASAARFDETDLRSLTGILARTYAIAQRPEQERMYRRAAIGIQPDLEGFKATQFERAAEFAARGAEACRAQSAALARLALGPEEYAARQARRHRRNPESALIEAIDVSGNERVSEALIHGRIRTRPGTLAEREGVRLDLLRIYGIGEFEQVMFRLHPGESGASRLEFEVQEKPWGPTYLQFGFRLHSDFDSDARWAMLLGLRRLSLNRLGAEWRLEGFIGDERALHSEFYQPLDYGGFLFVAPVVAIRSELQNIYQDDHRIAEYEVNTSIGRLDLGLQWRQHAELRFGPFWGAAAAEIDTGSAPLPREDDGLSGFEFSLAADRLDHGQFARQGSCLRIDGQFARRGLGGEASYSRLAALWQGAHSFGAHTLTASARVGSGLGESLPGYAQFTAGGVHGFAGLAEDELRGDELAIGSLGYRYRLLTLPSSMGRAVYAFARVDYGSLWEADKAVEWSDARAGGLLALGADTGFGVMLLGIGAAEEASERVYFTLGSSF